MEEKKGRFRERTKAFAVRVIRLYGALPKNSVVAQVIGKQFLRSATSVGAQYREAAMARSRAEFISKTQCALQELEETSYWFELLVEADIIPQKRLNNLIDESKQLTAMFVASINTSKRRRTPPNASS
ncbi:MAG TPA: four helix bundle protein [Pirellulales bacterium]|jgi:four helix bundle protein|nr:four helix bundle protein [Pirellulales bacterium]